MLNSSTAFELFAGWYSRGPFQDQDTRPAAYRLKTALELLDSDPHLVFERNKEGETPLFIAVSCGDIEIASLLYQYGADGTVVNANGENLLHRALRRNGHPSMVELVLEHGADPEQTDRWSETPLMAACLKYSLRAGGRTYESSDAETNFRRVLDLTTNVNHSYPDGSTVLHRLHEPSFVLPLLSRGADVDARDERGRTPLLNAVWNGHTEIARILFRHGADGNVKGPEDDPLLHIALTRNGYPEMVSLILENGADPEQPDFFGRTPLMLACLGYRAYDPDRDSVFADKEANFRRFLDLTRDVNIKDPIGRTALHFVREEVFLAPLLSRGANINGRDRRGQTPLHHTAASSGALIEPLLRYGADPNLRDRSGKTPLHYASINSLAPERTRQLVVGGANLEIQDRRGRTPLHGAATSLDLEGLRILLAVGANVNARDNKGRTPLGLIKAVNVLDLEAEYDAYPGSWMLVKDDIVETLVNSGGTL